jgi:ubiquinone/menaquinone biosynthesis C-methylase UbiE
MRRTVTPELLDSPDCPPHEIQRSLTDLKRINRWFGGVSTTRALIERVAAATSKTNFSLLEVAAGHGEVPRTVAQQLARKGISLDITDLDLAPTHLQPGHRAVVANALALPFRDSSFDLVSSNLFAHHLEPDQLAAFIQEALRVSRVAVLVNDLVRHPLHLALVYAGWPLLRSYVSRVDGVASVRRAYVPEEMREAFVSIPTMRTMEISRHYLFRMGVIAWKSGCPL